MLKTDEPAGGIVLFFFGLATALLSLKMPIGGFRMAGSGLFPLILGILLMFLSGLFVLRVLLKPRITEEKSAAPVIPWAVKQWSFFFGTIILVTLLLNWLGYPLSSFLLMAALLRTLGVKAWRGILPLSFLTALVCYLLFVQWLKIPLPKGWLGI